MIFFVFLFLMNIVVSKLGLISGLDVEIWVFILKVWLEGLIVWLIMVIMAICFLFRVGKVIFICLFCLMVCR